MSKVITQLWLLRLVIGLKVPRKFFSQLEAKPKPIAPCTRKFFPRFEQVTGNYEVFLLCNFADCSRFDWSELLLVLVF